MKNLKQQFKFKLTYLNLIHGLTYRGKPEGVEYLTNPYGTATINDKCFHVPIRVRLFMDFSLPNMMMYFEDEPCSYQAVEITPLIERLFLPSDE